MVWILYLGALFLLFNGEHHLAGAITALIGFPFCILWSSRKAKEPEDDVTLNYRGIGQSVGVSKSGMNTAGSKKTRKNKNYRKEEYIPGDTEGYYEDPENIHLQEIDRQEERRRRENDDFYKSENGSYSAKRESERARRKALEEEAYLLRKYNADHWKVKAADDALGRSEREREWENDKQDYQPVCNNCNHWESQCRCCNTCDDYPCKCCYKCKEYPCDCCVECGAARCRCCSKCEAYPCECCDECGQPDRYCRCCSRCDSYPCQCCDECREANCRCCRTCDSYPCQCCRTCDDFPCRCCSRCDSYPCECCDDCGQPDRYCRC